MITAIFGLAPALIHPAAASEPTTQTAEAQRYQLEIRSTTLSEALKDLAQQTSLQFARFSDAVPRTMIVGPLSGSYTRAQALDLLLLGTGLTYRFVNEHTVAIVAIVNTAPPSSPHSAPPPAPIKSSPPLAAPPVVPATPEFKSEPQAQNSTSKKKGWLGRLAGFFAVCGPLLAAGPAYCQNAAADTTTDTSTAQLQEVVVTAERRAENVQTTPISVVAVTGSDLQANTVLNVNTLVQVAPDLTVQSAGNSSMLDIRGLGTEAVGIQVSGVVVTRDGIPNVTGGTGLNTPFYDIADVEVLRGPQGTFSGGNSTGGAVDINSANPNFRGINGYVTAKLGTYSDQGVQGAVNLPVTDTFAMRLAFNEEQRNSFYYDEGTSLDGPNTSGNLYTPSSPTCPSYLVTDTPCASSGVTGKTEIDPGNVNDKDIRLGFLWKPTDRFQSLTKLEIDDSTTQGDPTQPNTNTFSPIGAGQPCPTGHGTAPDCTELYIAGYSGSPFVLNSWLAAELDDQEVSLFSEELRYTLPSGTVARFLAGDDTIDLTSLSNATADSIDIQNGQPNDSTTTYHIYNSEFDLISPTNRTFSWIVGASWLFSSGQLASFSTTTTAPYSPAKPAYSFYDDGEQVYTKTEGIFGQTTWQINPTLQFQIGARVSWDRVNGHGGLETDRASLGLPPIYSQATGAGSIAGAGDNAVPTGKIGLNWTPVQGQYFYVFWARGYTPGLENLGEKPPTTKSWVNDAEFGWKGTLADGHVVTQVGGYYMQYYNLIQSLFNINNVAGTVDGNIPFSIVKGLEASMQSHVGRLSFDIGADLNKSILGSVITAKTYAFPSTYGITNQCPAGVTPNAGNTNCTNYLPYLVNLSGEQLPFSPLFQGNASLKYSIPVGEMNVSPRVTYSYIGKSYASLFQTDNYFLLPPHGLVNAYLDWTAGPWTTTIYATNLVNKLYLTSIASTAEYFGAPRQLGLQVNRTF